MARAAGPPVTESPVQQDVWSRGHAVLFALTVTAVVLTVVQFLLAGLGAFGMDRTPPDDLYKPHVIVGLAIAVLTLLMLVTVLASRQVRANRVTLRLSIGLAVLAIAVQPALGEGGTHVPAVGALHALVAMAIFGTLGRFTWEMAARRRTLTR